MERELKSLSKALEKPDKPCVYVMGGAKADDSLEISKYVLSNGIADYVVTGGVTAQLFLAAKGVDLGKGNMAYLEKKELTGLIPGIQELIKQFGDKVRTPIDVAMDVNGKRKEIPTTKLPTENSILDIGKETAAKYAELISKAKSIVVSGPMGVYERKEFNYGTKTVLQAIAGSKAFQLPAAETPLQPFRNMV
jgi:phosphoglycerate kinase